MPSYFAERETFPVEVGDSVIYNPLYPVEGFWQELKGKEVVVHRVSESYLYVSPMTYAGLDEHEVPTRDLWKLNRQAFLPYRSRFPSWEV